MKTFTLFWNSAESPAELHPMLEELGRFHPIAPAPPKAANLFFRRSGHGLEVTKKGDAFHIAYSSLHLAARGIGLALAGLEECIIPSFRTVGALFDVSRNLVFTVPQFRKRLRQLALLGYNMVMLYTEDTYELPGVPCMGYLRGSYSLEEMRELDEYAARFGIEMVACIQTLGHLGQFLKWPGAAGFRDTDDVLLTDHVETYELIDRMFNFWSRAFRSRRIHIGMDEAHLLGRGRSLDFHGYENPFGIFKRHLARVGGLAGKYGFHPMIWSDMYFRLGSASRDYYDSGAVIPDGVRETIPRNIELVYWDYYHTDPGIYDRMIDRHVKLGFRPVMASGLWSWYRFWYDHRYSAERVKPCIESCRRNHLTELFFTMWGDDGAYCEFDSMLAGLAWASDLCYGNDGDDRRTARLYRAVTGGDYETVLLAGRINYQLPGRDNGAGTISQLFWDDPLMQQGFRSFNALDGDWYECCRRELESARGALRERALPESGDGGDLRYARLLFDVVIAKLHYQNQLRTGYLAGDREKLAGLLREELPGLLRLMARFQAAFRRQWLNKARPEGLEVIQIRNSGLTERLRESGRRVRAFLAGEVSAIPELELPCDTACRPGERYHQIATGSGLI